MLTPTINHILKYSDDDRLQCRGTNLLKRKADKVGARCKNILAADITLEAKKTLAKISSGDTSRAQWLHELAIRSLCSRHEDQVPKLVEELKGLLEGRLSPQENCLGYVACPNGITERPAIPIEKPLVPVSSSTAQAPTAVQQPMTVLLSVQEPVYPMRNVSVVEKSVQSDVYYPALPKVKLTPSRTARAQTPTRVVERPDSPPLTPTPSHEINEPSVTDTDTELRAMGNYFWFLTHHSNTHIRENSIIHFRNFHRDVEEKVRLHLVAIEEEKAARVQETTLAASRNRAQDTSGRKKYKVPVGWVQIGENKFVEEGVRVTRVVREQAGWPIGWLQGSDGLWEEIDDEDEL